MRHTRASVLRTLRNAGGSFEVVIDGPEEFDYVLDAPPGKMFRASQTHGVVVNARRAFREEVDAAWAAGASDIAMGFEDCDCGECARPVRP